jgi:hypothetical protein
MPSGPPLDCDIAPHVGSRRQAGEELLDLRRPARLSDEATIVVAEAERRNRRLHLDLVGAPFAPHGGNHAHPQRHASPVPGPAELGGVHAGCLRYLPLLAEPELLRDRRGTVRGRLGLERLPHDLPAEGTRVVDLRGASTHLRRRRPSTFSGFRLAAEERQPRGSLNRPTLSRQPHLESSASRRCRRQRRSRTDSSRSS